MAMFVSRLPVGMPRCEQIHVGKAASDRPVKRERERERLDYEEEPVD